MISNLKREVFINLGWLGGLMLVLAVLIGVSAYRLSVEKTRLVELRREMEIKEESVRVHPFRESSGDEQAAMESTLDSWQSMVSNESERIAELSKAARNAGVTLVAIKSLAEEFSKDGLVVSVSHELGARGNYRELSRFFNSLYDSKGAVGIEDIEIEPREVSPSNPEGNTLDVSVQVTWYAGAPSGPVASPTRGEG